MKLKLPTEKVSKINHLEAGKRVRNLRESKEMSLRRLAHLMGITPPYLSDMELGRRNWTEERYSLAMRILNGENGK